MFNLLHENINIPLLQFLNSFTENELLGKVIFFMADRPIFILPIFLLGFWLFFNYKKDDNGKNKLLFISYATILAILISISIQQFVDLERPETHLKRTGNMILSHIPDASFPSDHASVGSAFIFGLLFFGFINYFYFIRPLIIIMLLSRVRAGVHWPFDIIAGIIIGIISAFIIYKLQNLDILKKTNNFLLKIAKIFKL